MNSCGQNSRYLLLDHWYSLSPRFPTISAVTFVFYWSPAEPLSIAPTEPLGSAIDSAGYHWLVLRRRRNNGRAWTGFMYEIRLAAFAKYACKNVQWFVCLNRCDLPLCYGHRCRRVCCEPRRMSRWRGLYQHSRKFQLRVPGWTRWRRSHMRRLITLLFIFLPYLIR